ncbi:MAG: hypothetical protein LBJ37_13545, partial [Paucimonas sp.]|nr:hypothetical protein [Paucimonas sp.]
METIVSRYPSPTTRNPYQLNVADLKVPLDVISFEGSEYLGKPFHYTIRFTCAERKLDPKCYRDDPVYRDIKPRDLDKAAFLNRYTRFGLYGEPPITYPWEEKRRKHEPLREIFGVITSFKRTGATIEQGHYEITLEPRLARLAQGKQYRLYRRQSVPEIVR